MQNTGMLQLLNPFNSFKLIEKATLSDWTTNPNSGDYKQEDFGMPAPKEGWTFAYYGQVDKVT